MQTDFLLSEFPSPLNLGEEHTYNVKGLEVLQIDRCGKLQAAALKFRVRIARSCKHKVSKYNCLHCITCKELGIRKALWDERAKKRPGNSTKRRKLSQIRVRDTAKEGEGSIRRKVNELWGIVEEEGKEQEVDAVIEESKSAKAIRSYMRLKTNRVIDQGVKREPDFYCLFGELMCHIYPKSLLTRTCSVVNCLPRLGFPS